MSKFYDAISALQGQKVRFYLGGGERGFVQGPVTRVEDDLVFIEKEGEIRGTLHTITIHATQVRFFEIDTITRTD